MIGGNVEAVIEVKSTEKNTIGERVAVWSPVQSFVGFLDYSGGDAKRMTYDTKLQESTHIFLCDYAPMDPAIKTSNSRVVINGKVYDVLVYDDPMELHAHWEIFLRFIGE